MTRIGNPHMRAEELESLPMEDVACMLEVSSGKVIFVSQNGYVVHGGPPQGASPERHEMLWLEDGVLHTNRAEEDKALHEALSGLTVSRPTAFVCLRSRQGVTIAILDVLLLTGGRLVALRVTRTAPKPIGLAAFSD